MSERHGSRHAGADKSIGITLFQGLCNENIVVDVILKNTVIVAFPEVFDTAQPEVACIDFIADLIVGNTAFVTFGKFRIEFALNILKLFAGMIISPFPDLVSV